MPTTFPDSLLSSLSEFVATRTGLSFPPERWADLERGIAAAAPDFDFPDGESCARWLLTAPLTRRMNEVLASHLSVGETYFFRDGRSLEILVEQVLPQLLLARRQKRRLRIWSAGCCTGEEAYTIAILLDRLIPDLGEWNVTILATDFNPKFLRKAAQGVYGDWSFRDTPGWLRERYFNKRPDGGFEVHSRIRKMVTFSYLNFADDVYPSLSNNTSAMDLIFCRNVLMYFTAQRAREVIGNFHRALVDGGWLIVSPAEASNSLLSSFDPVEFRGVMIYRKSADTELGVHISGYRVPRPLPEISQPLPEAVVSLVPGVQTAVATTVDATADLQAEPAAPAIQVIPAGQHELPSRLAREHANQGRLDEALQWCQRAIATDKLNPAHHYLLATILQEQGRYDDAIQSLSRVLYLDPDFVLAHFALGNLYQAQGCYRQAQRHLENVLLLSSLYPPDEALPESDGLTAGRLTEIVTSLRESFPQAMANA